MIRYIYGDTEYVSDLHDFTGIVSIALHDPRRDDADYYAVNADMDYRRVRDSDWLGKNVWPHLPTVGGGRFLDLQHPDVRDEITIRQELMDWFAVIPEAERIELVCWYGARDTVNFRQFFEADWKATPRIPKEHLELRTLRAIAGRPDLPPRTDDWHHPVADARWARRLHEHITRSLPIQTYRADTCLVLGCTNTDFTTAAPAFERVGIGSICGLHGRPGRMLGHWPTMVPVEGLPHHIDCDCGWAYTTETWSGEATAAWALHAVGAGS